VGRSDQPPAADHDSGDGSTRALETRGDPWAGRSTTPTLSADPEQLDLEDERGARRDHAARAALTVAQMGRDAELARAAHPHRAGAFVPALDDASLADGKAQRLAAVVRRIELLAALEPAGVVHAHLVARTGRWSRPFHEVDVPESGGGLDDLFA